MYTNQLNDVCNGVHFFLTKLQIVGVQFYLKYASLHVFFKIFAQICSVIIYKGIFEVLRTSVSQKTPYYRLLTVVRFSKYSFL